MLLDPNTGCLHSTATQYFVILSFSSVDVLTDRTRASRRQSYRGEILHENCVNAGVIFILEMDPVEIHRHSMKTGLVSCVSHGNFAYIVYTVSVLIEVRKCKGVDAHLLISIIFKPVIQSLQYAYISKQEPDNLRPYIGYSIFWQYSMPVYSPISGPQGLKVCKPGRKKNPTTFLPDRPHVPSNWRCHQRAAVIKVYIYIGHRVIPQGSEYCCLPLSPLHQTPSPPPPPPPHPTPTHFTSA